MKKRIWLGTAVLIIFLAVGAANARAQVVDNRWTTPRLLSGPDVTLTSEASMVTDPYGILHLFWREENPDDGIQTIQHATFDGEVWSEAVDIFAAPPRQAIESIAPTIDAQGTIHLVWNEGVDGPVYYATAPANKSLTARAWSSRLFLEQIEAYRLGLHVDSQGVLHLVFINFYGNEPGIYYTRSEDAGKTWTPPYWLDPDIPLREAPSVMKFEIDDEGGLHVLWNYLLLDTASALGDWVRYTHSLDGGQTWAVPETMDLADDAPDELRLPYPSLGVVNESVHIIWAGNSLTQRETRTSSDRGVTFGKTERVFGGLVGQALGDGVAVDGRDRLHFFGQIRWPQGLYHAVWEADAGWSEPEMIYLIAADAFEGRNGRYHAHNVRAAVLRGNQLVVTFTDEPIGPLYVMVRRLEDVAASPVLPTPTRPIPTPIATSEAVLTRLPTPKPQFDATAVSPPGSNNLARSLWVGVLPAAVILFLALIFRLFRQK